jgi:3-hydroxybutyryl-CoA dehydrogenase
MFVKSMPMSQFPVVCVCGAGTMGTGIAQTAAQSGLRTQLFDVDAAKLLKSREQIENALLRLQEKQKITAAQREATLSLLSYTANIETCTAGVVIEAIVEDLQAKLQLFHRLASLNSPQTIFATNTSSLAITALAQHIPHPERVVGMHFFNPAPVMKLVEVIRTNQTAAGVVQTVSALAVHMGKTPVVCKDAPGFIVNRVARPYYLEALRLAESGAVTIEQADRLLEASGFKMGPFRLMDLIGMDINYAVSRIVWDALGQPARLRPSALQQHKVEQGELGRKTGRGFYTYQE